MSTGEASNVTTEAPVDSSPAAPTATERKPAVAGKAANNARKRTRAKGKAAPARKVPAAKAGAKAPVKKRPAAKAKAAVKGKKKATKASTPGKPRAKKEGLRKPQVRVLATLKKHDRAMTRAEIGDKGGVDLAMMTSYLGSSDASVRAKNDKRNFPSLMGLGFIKEVLGEEGGAVAYRITATGKTALDKATS